MTKAGAKAKPKSGFDKSVLFEDHREVLTVDVPPYGMVSYQSLTRQEAIGLGELKTALDIEANLISLGVVAIDGEPVDLSINDVKRWQAAASGMALEPLSDAIARASGLHEEAEREAVQRFPEGTGD